ncbi:hypothetical protein AB0L05_07135 [Nonomuraea pusilla]|uniref:ABC transporter permease n=1 Tax=Nonomuraea pusilla TaxID=46177 RepID=UPI00332F7837
MTATLTPARSRARSRTAGGHLTGAFALVRLALRRDRVKLPIWLLAIAAMVPRFYHAAATIVAPTPESRAEAAQMIKGSYMRVLAGPVFGDEAVTSQSYFLAAYWVEFLLAAGLMNILLITRHTRAEEQTGHAELIRAAAVGRYAQLTAALLVALLADAVLAVLAAAGAIGVGFPAGGALLFGASLAAAGLVFAAVTAVTAQITEQPRAAAGMAGVTLFAAWIVRGAGALQDQEGGPVFWLSPIGWSQQTRVLAGDRWWPLALPVLLAALLTAVAYAVAGRRDLGAALVTPRPGHAEAPSWLRSPFTLALRLQRATIGWWAGAFLAVGIVLGGMAGAMATTDLAIFPPGADLGRAWISLMVFTGSLYTCVFALLSVVRLRTEELRGLAGAVLAGPTGRSAWYASSLLVSALGAALLLAAYGAGLGIGAAASTGEPGLAGEVVRASLLRLPEALVLLAVAAALLGLAPRALGLTWAVFLYSALVQVFGPYMGVPEWLTGTSVLSYLPWHPLGASAPAATAVLTALAALLALLGLYGLRRRDLASG